MVHHVRTTDIMVQVVDQGCDGSVDGAQCALEEAEFVHAEVRDVLVRVLELCYTH